MTTWRRRLGRLVLVSGLLAILTACASAPDSGQSKGLGLAEGDWKQLYGEGVTNDADQNHVTYESEGLVITYEQTGNGPRRVAWIRWRWGDEDVPFAEASEKAQTLLPNDAKLVKTLYGQRQFKQVYTSGWLKGKFPGHVWTKGKAGDFTVVYDAPKVASTTGFNAGSAINIVLGNNP